MQQWATTEQGEYTDLYDPAIASLLTVPVADEWPDTRDGRAHVLTAGDPRAPPRVVFQGGNATIPRWATSSVLYTGRR